MQSLNVAHDAPIAFAAAPLQRVPVDNLHVAAAANDRPIFLQVSGMAPKNGYEDWEITCLISEAMGKRAVFSRVARASASYSVTSRRQPIGYRRFAHAADAVRFAIEELPSEFLLGANLEVDEELYRHRRRPRNLAQKIQTCGDDLLSQLIGLGDLSGLHHRPSPRRQYRRLLAPNCATCGYSVAIADTFVVRHARTQKSLPKPGFQSPVHE